MSLRLPIYTRKRNEIKRTSQKINGKQLFPKTNIPSFRLCFKSVFSHISSFLGEIYFACLCFIFNAKNKYRTIYFCNKINKIIRFASLLFGSFFGGFSFLSKALHTSIESTEPLMLFFLYEISELIVGC